MKLFLFTILLGFTGFYSSAQPLDFQNTVYYTAVNNNLINSGQNLSAFNYNTANSSHPLLNNGVFFQVTDSVGVNLWVRVRHIAADPNGNSVGVNVSATTGGPFRVGAFGGWAGFLYQFDIYRDANLTGPLSYILSGLFPTNITVESIETLSAGELVIFESINSQASNWALNSINFTGLNPTSQPGFSGINIPWNSTIPPAGFSTTFPSSKNIYVVDYGSGNYYAEFRMRSANVSQFRYGYEYNELSNGYQGMRMYFGRSIQNSSIQTISASICQGNIYTFPDLDTASVSITDTSWLISNQGFDSIIITNLSVIPYSVSNSSTQICQGETYLGHSMSGSYIDTLTSLNGCDSIVYTSLTVSPASVSNFSTQICRGENYLGYTETGNYLDTLISSSGCDSIVFINLTVSENCDVLFPSAFSPNNDNLNDVFSVLNTQQLSEYYLAIYNRWGQKVFETNDFRAGWNGRFNEVDQPIGGYVWYSRFTRNGQKKNLKGNLLLLR